MRKYLYPALLFSYLLVIWVVDVYHLGVFPKPDLPTTSLEGSWGKFIPKQHLGIHQLLLKGSDYQRGIWAGRYSKELLFLQEKELSEVYYTKFPNPLWRFSFQLFLTRWFSGVENYIPDWAAQEMMGVAESAPIEFSNFGDNLTRQVIYHGLNDVGQIMVDTGTDDMGCTVLGVKTQGQWIIGRNFDFEGGRTFDREKLMKWVFPEHGIPYLSVIWAGMVGAVTGVNEKGVYVSLNAAGSTDLRRYGRPATLVITNALQWSTTAEEAIRYIEQAETFITYIFVVVDRNGRFYRVEKSPAKTAVIESKETAVVTNHLIAPEFETDSVNIRRRTEHTSHYRAARGEELISELNAHKADLTSDQIIAEVLQGLRDKSEVGGKPLMLGNRRSIDALIATHSVIYDPAQNYFSVSQGPGVSGQFSTFDLSASFAKQTPVMINQLPADPQVSEQVFNKVRLSAQLAQRAQSLVHQEKCQQAADLIERAEKLQQPSSTLFTARGFVAECQGDIPSAKQFWQQALELKPAYAKDELLIKQQLEKYEKL